MRAAASRVELQLPQRIFVKPVARALIEQRRILALDADAKPLVLAALDALTIAPEQFTPETAVYLGLRAIYFDLAHAKSRRPAARSGGAHVGHGGAARGRQCQPGRAGAAPGAGRACARRSNAAPATKSSRS